ncbi:MAG: ParB/Srx family N-terminal domain-containing protein [Methylococcales bacterium]
MGSYEWLEKRTPRSVEQLRLWADNPRLAPEERHIHISDFVADLMSDQAEKDHFMKLIQAIVSDGFIPADPIIVWRNPENEKYYVAEGNRRVLALKLLRSPDKAPISIRNFITKLSRQIDRDTIEKVGVNVAPTFEDCEWYINQRHATSTLQRKWSRLQQQRWIAELYDKYKGDLNQVMSITKFSKGELDHTLRILQIRDLALHKEIFNLLTDEEKESVSSHRVPMTIFERWFLNSKVKEVWGISSQVDKVIITSNRKSFYAAYLQWLKYVIRKDEVGVEVKINTRTIDSNLDALLEALPKVTFEPDEETESPEQGEDVTNGNTTPNGQPNNGKNGTQEEGDNNGSGAENGKPSLYQNPDRRNIIVSTCKLNVKNFKLNALFGELKRIPMDRYRNCLASSLRVFLDLAVAEYITSEGMKNEISKFYKRDFQEVVLKHRLEYLKANKLKAKTQPYKIVEKLLNPSNDFSLDTLNSYIHGSQVHHVERKFLNRFWDFLFPLMNILVDIEEA